MQWWLIIDEDGNMAVFEAENARRAAVNALEHDSYKDEEFPLEIIGEGEEVVKGLYKFRTNCYMDGLETPDIYVQPMCPNSWIARTRR